MTDFTILVVDDERRIAESLADLLGEQEYRVHWTTSGREAVEWLGQNEADLVITDLRMPDLDGFGVIEELAASKPDVAVIVITGHASTESAIEAIHKQVADYIPKPFEFERLLLSVKRVYERVETERLRRDTVRMITHDIKVPLSSVMGYAEFLDDPRHGDIPPKVREFSRKIVLNSQRILALLDNFLTQARVEEGRLAIQPIPVRLDDVVEDAIRLHQPEFETKHIALTSDIHGFGRDVYYLGDEPLLSRALGNILSNALKYTPRGGQTHVALSREDLPEHGECYCIAISNNGPSLSEEERETIFERYSRADSSRGISGSGLGLYVVWHVARAHGGCVTCESVPDGLTTFRLILPIDHLRRDGEKT
ncbi:MAG: response regulator [Sumerlaeia bacterium]